MTIEESKNAAEIAADAYRALGCQVAVNARSNARDARLVVRTPQGYEFTVQIEDAD
jgi:hypothetical protein